MQHGVRIVALLGICLGACARHEPPVPQLVVNQRGVGERMAFAVHATSGEETNSAELAAREGEPGGEGGEGLGGAGAHGSWAGAGGSPD